MYIVKSGIGYVLDSEKLLMTSEIEEAKVMCHVEAEELIDRIEKQGFSAEVVCVSSSIVHLDV